MKQVHVIVTWQSEHVVEIDEEDGLDNLAELLQAQANVKLVSYTARPLERPSMKQSTNCSTVSPPASPPFYPAYDVTRFG